MIVYFINLSGILTKNASLLNWLSPFVTGIIESTEALFYTLSS
jgi:hypothetical protein